MDNINNELSLLQSKINELEKLKKEKEQEELKKKQSVDYNLLIINNELVNKKQKVQRNNYSKSVPLARFNDENIIKFLEPIYNSLQIINERLNLIEANLNLIGEEIMK